VSYRTIQAELMPTGLRDPYGQSFTRAFGIIKDHYAQRARTAVMQRFPDHAAEDALGALGDERGIDRGDSVQRSPPEARAAYAARVKDAWEAWTLGGTAWGMLKAFAHQGYFPYIKCANGLVYNVDVDLNLTITDGPPLPDLLGLWSQFFVWFATAPTSWTDIQTPPTPTSIPSIYEVRRIRHAIIDRWKPAWTRCVGIGVLVSGGPGIWGAPGAKWGTGTWGSAVIRWFSATDSLTWGFPPSYKWGMAGLTWGGQV
jgi:hypothetical protein